MKHGTCGFMKCTEHDVVCTLHNIVLGDAKDYSGDTCNICTLSFFNALSKRLAKAVCVPRKKEKLSDCDYCRNAVTCGELTHDNDLSYAHLAYHTDSNTRMFFRTGNNQATVILVEEYTKFGWKPTMTVIPQYCPFCGRELVENRKHLEKGRKTND